jgi:phospholipid/cholesterol/gamma-HCH transport system substrate-binding protein
MTRSPMRDFLVGLFVLVGLGAVAYLSFSVGGLSYSGPKLRAPVVISGVKVGQVKSITLDKSFRARVEMDLDARLKIPTDTTASIVTAGILGDRYVSLQLGGEEQDLKPGESISFTESAVILESLIGKFIYGRGGESGSSGGEGGGGGGGGGGTGSNSGGGAPQKKGS